MGLRLGGENVPGVDMVNGSVGIWGVVPCAARLLQYYTGISVNIEMSAEQTGSRGHLFYVVHTI